MSSVHVRAGLAYEQGAPLGAAIDTGKSTTTTHQAITAGQLLSPAAAGASLTAVLDRQRQQTALNPTGRDVNADGGDSWAQKHIADPLTWAGGGLLKALNFGYEHTTDAFETGTRFTVKRRSGSFAGELLAPINNGPWNAEWRAEWGKVRAAESTPMQTLWETTRNWGRDGEYEGMYDLLDNPNREVEQAEYFGGGSAKWVTGIGDAAFSIFGDPLGVVGKGVSIARVARNTVKATDVAAAARGTSNLTRGGRRVEETVSRVVEASERVRVQSAAGTKGGYAALASTKFLGQSADAGAIPYFLSKIDDEVDDVVRNQMKRDALFAGMGDKAALARLEAKNADLSLELESFIGPNRASAVSDLLARKDFSHLDNLRAVDEDAWLDRVIASHADEIKSVQDALSRVHKVGSPTGLKASELSGNGVGELARLADSAGGAGRDMMRVGKTIHRGAGLPPVHVLTGRKLPGTFSLAADDAFQSFDAALQQGRGAFFGSRGSTGTPELDNHLRGLADEFAMAHSAVDPAASRAARRAVVDKFNRVMERGLAKMYAGGDKETERALEGFIREVRSKRTSEMAHLHERSYRARAAGTPGYTQTEDGVLVWNSKAMKDEIATPFDGTQLEDVVSIPDYRSVEKAIKTHLSIKAGGVKGLMTQAADGTWRLAETGLSMFNDLWKFSALFRIGYPIRNQVDSQARLIATLGGMRYASYLMQGSKNMAHNLGKVSAAEAEHAARVASARMRLEALDDLPTEAADAAAVERKTLQDIIDTPSPAPEGAGIRRRDTALARHIGLGTARGSAHRSAADVRRGVDTVDARESTLGLLTDAAHTTLRDVRQSQHVQSVAGSNPLWEKSFLDVVNKRVRNSHAMMSMLAGADDAAIAAWYRNDDAGRAIWKALEPRYERVEDLIAVQREQLDTLLPEGRLRSLAMGGDLTPSMVADEFPVKTRRPAVPAQMMEAADSNPVASAYNKTRSWWFKYASEIPETMLARHPYYTARKTAHLERTLEGIGDWDKVSLSQYNAAAHRAAVLAKRDVANVMFDTSQRSNLAHHLRFLSPFYSAWSDTMRKWGRIMGENLEIVPLVPKVFMAPNKMFVTVDNEGNRIEADGDIINADGEVVGKSTNPTDGFLLIPVPEWITSWTGGSDTLKVNKGSLNVIFQGDPFFLPGPGPMASIPVNELMTRAMPEMFGSAPQWADSTIGKYLLPYGTDDASVLEQAMPMWAKNLKTAISQDFNDDRFAQTYAMLMAEEVNAQRLSGQQMPRAELEGLISTRTRNWFLLRFLGSQAPFSTQPTGRLEYYRSEWQRYQREHGAGARERFYQDYPDYFEASISLSLNESGITATDASWNEVEKYKAEIQSNKKYGWMWVGAANTAPGFDQGVYTAQKAQGLRSTKDPLEAFNDLQVSKGWYEYQKVAGAMNLKLEQRKASGGSGSMSAKSNADLKAIRDEAVQLLKSENVQWANEFESGGNGTGVAEFIRTAAQAAADRPELVERSDFVALDQYLEAREVVKLALAQRGLSSLSSESASDLRAIWDEYVADLVASDIGFEQMYTRGRLDRDDMTGG